MKLIYYVLIAQLFIAHVVSAQTNAKPTVNAGTDKKLASTTTTVSLTGTASDSDGTIVTYAWTRVKGPQATLANADQPTLTLTDLKKGIYTFRLTVTDNSAATASDEVLVIYDQPTRKIHTKGSNPENHMYYWEYLPEDYATSSASKKYPLILFLHGCGERSYTNNCEITVPTAFDSVKSYNELDKVLKFGPPVEIMGGKKMCFKNPSGVEECFIIMSPQLSGRVTKTWSASIIQSFLNTILTTYTKVDKSRVYVTGISLGGYGTNSFAQGTQALAPSVAAIAPVAADGDEDNACILKIRNIPVWAFHGDKDVRVPFARDKEFIDSLIACDPTPLPRFTVYPGRAHDSYVFNTPYKSALPPDPNYPETLYEWFLKFSKPTSPVVNAGADRTITLPTNTLTLHGTATDPDGISTYTWTKQSGPAATLSTANQPSLTVSNMVAGLYVFRLTATDTKGEPAFDDVNVTVNSASGGSWLELTSTGASGKSLALFYDPPKEDGNQEKVEANFLEFYIKNISGPTPPLSLKIELTVRFNSGTGTVLVGNYISSIPAQWTKVTIPLADFGIAADRWSSGGVSQVKFKIISGFEPGVFGIDEIRFTNGSIPLLWYGDTHELSGTVDAVKEQDATFKVSNRFTTGGAPTATAASARITPSFATDELSSAEDVEKVLTQGNIVHVYTMQGSKVDTFVCPANCSIETLSKITEHGIGTGLYILHVVDPAGNRAMLKVNIQK